LFGSSIVFLTFPRHLFGTRSSSTTRRMLIFSRIYFLRYILYRQSWTRDEACWCIVRRVSVSAGLFPYDSLDSQRANRGRSATIVAAYLMYSKNLDPEGALKLVRQARPFIECVYRLDSVDAILILPFVQALTLIFCSNWKFSINQTTGSRSRKKIFGDTTSNVRSTKS
jgi:hypothetical protein